MIRFDDVTMVYTPGAQPALDHVSLEVEREEFVFLVGKSGSGKSTFLQLVMREMKATSGKVWVLGKDVSKLSTWAVPKLRRQIGTVFQDFRLLPSKTVYENVALAMQVIGKPRHAIETSVPDALDLVGLSGKESRLPHELSGGEEQRVAIARACCSRMSPPATSTPRRRWASCDCSTESTARARPSSWRPTTPPLLTRCASASSNSRPATLSATRTAASTGPGGKESEASFYFLRGR